MVAPTVEGIPGWRGNTQTGHREGGQREHQERREPCYRQHRQGTHGKVGNQGLYGPIKPQGMAALALHWGIPPHISHHRWGVQMGRYDGASPLNAHLSSTACMAMVPTWL